MSNLLPPKGTRDFYPDDMVMRNHIFSSWEKTCRRYGFESYDAPVFEHLDLYTQKSGDEIEKQLYTFEDKSGRRLALRPEMTPSLARMVAAKGTSIGAPVRWYSIPKLFRYEKMQKGRLREFFQLNMDILGIAGTEADAELIAAAIDTMRDLGLDHTDFSVRVSSRNLLVELFMHAGMTEEQLPALYALLDKKNKLPADEFERQLAETVVDTAVFSRVVTVLSASTLNDIRAINPNGAALKDLDKLFLLIDAYGMNAYLEFDIGIVRGLAYYTGIVFEVFDKKRTMRAIAGGGRYDKLVGKYGGPATPATGFAVGDVVLSDLLRDKGLLPEAPARADVFICSFAKDDAVPAIRIAQQLRAAGISAEYSLKGGNVGKQMKTADTARSKIALFVGGDEEARGEVKMKIMASGEEKTIAKTTLIAAVTEILS